MADTSVRPFRFTAQVPDFRAPLSTWHDDLRRLEDTGFSTVAFPDHFTGGYEMEPFVMLTAASAAPTRLRLQTAVLGNDYRHPVLTHRLAATLDVISEGRLELGIGAGWMRSDYEAAGLAYDRPGLRIDRLEESVTILRGLFSGSPLTFAGSHFQVHNLVGVPQATQQGGPPLLIGGGGPRMLRLAGRAADIVGLNANLSSGDLGHQTITDVGWEQIEQKVAWVAEGAASVGRDLADLELTMAQWLLHVTDDVTEADTLLAKLARRLGVEPAWLEAAPGVLLGSPQRCIEKLIELRERLGVSYVQVHSGPRSTDLAAVGQIVSSLAGR